LAASAPLLTFATTADTSILANGVAFTNGVAMTSARQQPAPPALLHPQLIEQKRKHIGVLLDLLT